MSHWPKLRIRSYKIKNVNFRFKNSLKCFVLTPTDLGKSVAMLMITQSYRYLVRVVKDTFLLCSNTKYKILLKICI